MDPLYIQIKEKYQLGPAIHMTHIDNLNSIARTGRIKCYNDVQNSPYTKLSNDDIQTGRAAITIKATGRPLHDYVPLYFGYKTPMVACNQHQNESLLFIRFSLEILKVPGVVFTDGNARSSGTNFFKFRSIDDLAVLDGAAINSVRWGTDREMKRKKQSELLLPDFLAIAQSLEIITFSKIAQTQSLAKLSAFGINKPVRVNPGYYFHSTISPGVKS